MARATTDAISPFFIVSDVDRTIRFYSEKLGFEVTMQEPERNPFFAIIRRDGAQIFVKSERNVVPMPNPRRHPYMRWDAYVFVPAPGYIGRRVYRPRHDLQHTTEGHGRRLARL